MNSSNISAVKVVIVNWCRAADTIECIRSVLKNDIVAEQVILVDNGSTDDSVSQISTAVKDIQIHALPENRGFAGGYNFGIETALKSTAKYIFLLNNDTVVAKDAIPLLINEHWDVGVPKIYYHNLPQVIWSAGARWRKFPPMVVMRGYQKPENGRFANSEELDYATACALMIKREVFEKAGFFDPDYINYFEDYDFMFRVKKAGFKIGFIPEAIVWHKGAQSLGHDSPKQAWYLGRNSVLFYRKDNRFSKAAFYCYLIWISFREILKLNLIKTWNFWSGVRDGMAWIKNGKSSL